MLQVGNIFDDSVDTNLEQCRMNCEHNVKLFSYDQVKKAKSMKALEIKLLEVHLRIHFLNDTLLAEHERVTAFNTQQDHIRERESKLQEFSTFYQGIIIIKLLDYMTYIVIIKVDGNI